jgi:glycerol-3-phosphate O-acyltransferase/dihydroxyacetone phosphate acyltransferase
VKWGNAKQKPPWLALLTLLYRCGKLLTLGVATLPSLALFWPIFITTKIISTRKQRAALAASVVKLKGRDVVSTWKILVAMGLAPMLYCWYTFVMTLWLHHCRHNGYYAPLAPWAIRADTYVSDKVPLPAFSVGFFGLLIAISFAGLRFGEIGVDIIKSLRPLLIILGPRSGSALSDIRDERQRLSARVVAFIHTFGSEELHNLERMGLDASDFYDDHPEGLPAGGPGSLANGQTTKRNTTASSSTNARSRPYYDKNNVRPNITKRSS